MCLFKTGSYLPWEFYWGKEDILLGFGKAQGWSQTQARGTGSKLITCPSLPLLLYKRHFSLL